MVDKWGRRKLRRGWASAWMALAVRGVTPQISTRMAELAVPPHYGRHGLASFHAGGYIASTATIFHRQLSRGAHTSIADRVLIYQDRQGGEVRIGEHATINYGVCIQTGERGTVTIGARTHIQPRCQLSAYVGAINIGSDVSIAPNCSFYPYDHEMDPRSPIREQGLFSKGDVIVGNGVWIGTGAILLSGANIGEGAVVGAGAVVKNAVPPLAIVGGVPARILGSRWDWGR